MPALISNHKKAEIRDSGLFPNGNRPLSLSGFTLVEIIVATVILSLIILGMLSVFVAGNKHIIHIRERMTGTELGKLFIDPMQAYVRQDAWGQATNSLYIPALPATSFTSYCDSVVGHTQNPACPPLASDRKVNNRDFSAQYDVSRVLDSFGADTGMRRVTTTVTWNE